MKITIGDYLLKRIKEVGINHIIGVPGDYNLEFLEQISDSDVEFIGTSNELNAGYAADGYSRENGISALLLTYGVGDLGAIGAVAGSSAEHVPVIVISGAPPQYIMENHLSVHHSVADGDYENVSNVYREFNIKSYKITHSNAQETIDKAITEAIKDSLPVNILLPSDLSYLEIEDKEEKLKIKEDKSDERSLKRAIDKIKACLSEAKKPVVLIDMDAKRFNILNELLEIIERNKIPFAQLATGKALLNESNDLFVGTYKGKDSEEKVKDVVENSDLIITTNLNIVEWNSGEYSLKLSKDNMIIIDKDYVMVKKEVFEGVYPKELLINLKDEIKDIKYDYYKPSNDEANYQTNDESKDNKNSEVKEDILNHKILWELVVKHLKENDLVYAETGSALHGLSDMKFDKKINFVGSNVWGAIGFTLPAYFGSLLVNSDKRKILFIGDGSLQVTVQALSRILYYKLKPIIFILNNNGYTIERYIMGMKKSYNHIPMWDYTALTKTFDKESNVHVETVKTTSELENVFSNMDSYEDGLVAEIILYQEDAPEALKDFGPKVAKFNYGKFGPKNEIK